MTRGLRTLVVVLLALSSATHARAATETDPARCKASYEGAQVALQQQRFEGARAELLTCQQLCPAPLARDCTRWLAEVDATAPTVRLRARDASGRELTNVLVSLDGVLVEHPDRAVPVDPGAHVFHFEGAGYAPADARVEVHAGERDRAVSVVLTANAPPPPAPAAPAPSGSIAPSLVAGSIGVVALLTAGALGIDGQIRRSNLRSNCAPHCSQSDVDAIATIWTFSAALAIVGVVSVGIGVALWPGWKQDARSKGSAVRLEWRAQGPALLW